jgi:four helix bundle protein
MREETGRPMDYNHWAACVPEQIKRDALWRVEAYRLALFAVDIGWYDVTKLMGDRRTHGLSDQLYRALGSVSANLAEGYSRGTGRDRAHFYEYALGSARESRDWYFKARHVLGDKVTEHRLDFLTQITRLLLTMIPQQREGVLREQGEEYSVAMPSAEAQADARCLDAVLQNVPLP